ncbi:hypothetical protein OEW28_14315 [Defluviimonas sp. WL0002]|uniref:Uncharacterized protein n=1 Tax=Albidovulum marisflavi TaxID=2984159 RepID=A0ABT2ZGC7_9RHOB|nr:hypothetical protein [Defluviimonas sp. WL0002]MCV2869806.1 hypothetical protein [Defluviimonas sp. WL0002]
MGRQTGGRMHGEDGFETYPDGMRDLIAARRRRRAGLVYHEGEALPLLDVDLDALVSGLVPDQDPAPLPRGHSSFARKRHDLLPDFRGKPELCLLNALLIANLRKFNWPEQAPALFLRIWREKADLLLEHLNSRWLISSIITFAEHGPTEADRRIGQSMNVLFSLMKLYEYERQYSGTPSDEPFRIPGRAKGPLPLNMLGFQIVGGDLEANLLLDIVEQALAAPNAGPLATALMDRLNRDPRNIFRRFALMRHRLELMRLNREEAG